MKKFYLLLALLLVSISPHLWADPVELPYSNPCLDLSTLAATEAWMGKKWQCTASNHFYVQQVYASKIHQDASVFFPEMEFKAGKGYKIVANFRHLYAGTTGDVRVYLCSSPTYEDRVGNELLQVTDFEANIPKDYTIYYTPTADETRFVEINCYSAYALGQFYVTSFSVEEASFNTPAAPTDLTVTPDANGERKASFSVTAPTKTAFGETLTSLKDLKVLWDGKVIYTINNPNPGQTYQFDCNFSQNGTFTFSAVASTEDGTSPATEAKGVIGITLPAWDIQSTSSVYDENRGWYHACYATYLPGQGVKLKLDPHRVVENGTYTITRMPEETVIAENVADPDILDENFPTESTIPHYYKVDSYKEDGTFVKTTTSSVIGLNNKTEYFVNFNDVNKESSREFTAYDLDVDASCWGHNGTTGNLYVSARNHNDWLMSPGVVLDKDKYYCMSVSAGTGSLINVTCGMELGYSYSNNPDNIKTVLDYSRVFGKQNDYYTFNTYFKPEESGNAFLGIHSYNVDNPDTWDDLRIKTLNVYEVNEDLPGKVGDFRVIFDSATDGKLSLIASTTNIAGNEQKELTEIRIYKDNELYYTIENPVPGETYTVPVQFAEGESNIYRAIPYNQYGEGVPADVQAALINPPYTNSFAVNTAFDGWTFLDNLNDGYTWGIQAGEARCFNAGNMDEWAVTPPVLLEAGKYYKVQISANHNAEYEVGSMFEMKLGKECSREGLDQQIIRPYSFQTSAAVLLKDYFTVEETGTYYLGMHAWNENGGSVHVYARNLSISNAIDPMVPDSCAIYVTPDKMGELTCTVRVTLPRKALCGEKLENMQYSYLYVDGVQVKSKSVDLDIREYEVELTGLTHGPHLFTHICKNNKGEGREYDTVAFIGINRPNVPASFTPRCTENTGEVRFTWEAPETDYDGFWINPDLVTYDLFIRTYNANTGKYEETPIAQNLEGVYEYTAQIQEATAAQQFYTFGIRAFTTEGGSPGLVSESLAVGPADKLPWTESFAQLKSQHIFRVKGIGESGYATWGLNSVDPVTGTAPVDNDGGLAIMEAIFAEFGAGLCSGKVELNAEHPVASFYVYDYSNSQRFDNNTIGIQVRTENGQWTEVQYKPISEWTGGNGGWQKVTIDLSEYAGQTVELAFVSECFTHRYTVMDGIRIQEANDNDMSVTSFSLPDEAYVGKPFTANVSVKNNSSADCEKLPVRLYCNDNEVASTEIDLAKGETKSVEFTTSVSREDFEATKDFIYYAKIENEDDSDPIDNESTRLKLRLPNTAHYPAVRNLDAAVSGTDVALSWEAPEIPEEAQLVTDDFESYDSWSNLYTGIGDYTLYDQDHTSTAGGITYAGSILVSWPMDEEQQSFFVIDFDDPACKDAVTFSPDIFSAHSGSKALASMSTSTGDAVYDVFVSPTLTGEAQTISFYAKSFNSYYPESFTVYYSTAGRDMADFKQSFEACTNVPSEYTKYEFELPEGTKYFAISRYNSTGLLFLVDDLQYTPAGNELLSLEGYNVYRNDEILAANLEPAAKASYADKNLADGTYNYAVTALYNRGEGPEAIVSALASGIDDVTAGKPYAAGLPGQLVVVNAAGLRVNVFSTDGIVLESLEGTDRMSMPMPAGIYIVTIGEQTFKVTVR